MRKIEKYKYKNNNHNERFTFKGLMPGDILIAKKSKNGLGGYLHPYPCELIINNNEYKVYKISSFGFYTVPWIIDEDGNCTIPDYDDFELKK